MKCYQCKECNGLACKGQIPGLGGKGSGEGFIRNVAEFKKYQTVKCENPISAANVDPSLNLWGQTVSMPIFLAPIAGIQNNYGVKMSDADYTKATALGCAKAKTLVFTGDGVNNEAMFKAPIEAAKEVHANIIATMKPWIEEGIELRLPAVDQNHVVALATDVDSVGLPLLQNAEIPVEEKTCEKLKALKEKAKKPFIVKGVISLEQAKVAYEANADAIVISNHGGRVDETMPTALEVLPEIAAQYKGKMTLFLDGGVRNGKDVFVALAMGADAVLIGRPLALSAVKGGAEAVCAHLTRLQEELKQVMADAGVASCKEIKKEMVTKS